MSQKNNLRFDYTLCSENGDNYYVLMDGNGSTVAASDSKEEIIKKASEINDDGKWVAAFPKHGTILNIPPGSLPK